MNEVVKAEVSQEVASSDSSGKAFTITSRILVVVYFVLLTVLSQVSVTLVGRDGSPSAFGMALSFRSSSSQYLNPLLDQSPGYIQQALGHLGMQFLATGHSPWWDPYTGLGVPLAQEFQSAVFYPVSLLFYGTGLGNSGWDLVALADTLIAGLCAYWLARVLGMRARGALVVGTAFCLSGSFVWFGTLFANVLAWSPASLALTVRLLRGDRSSRRRDVLLLGAVTALQVLGGFPESLILQGLVLTVPMTVALLVVLPKKRIAAVLSVAEGFGLGLAATAFLWVPFVISLSAEVTWNAPGTGMTHLPVWTDLVLLVPFGFGHWFSTSSLSINQWYHLGGYLGIVATWLAVVGLCSSWRKRLPVSAALASSLVVALGWINGLPPLSWIAQLPGFDRLQVGRVAVPELVLAVAILAGFAVDAGVPWVASMVATVFCGAALWLLSDQVPGRVYRHDLFFAVACLGLLALGVSILHGWSRWGRHGRAGRFPGVAMTGLALGLVVVELLTLANLDWRNPPPRRTAEAVPGWIAYVRHHLGGGRLYAGDALLSPNYSGDFSIPELSFEDAVVPKATVAFVQRAVDPQNADSLAFLGVPMAATLPSHVPELELAGVTLVAAPDPGCASACSGLRLRYLDRAAGVGVYEVPDPQRMLWFPEHVVSGNGVPARPLQEATADPLPEPVHLVQGKAVATFAKKGTASMVIRVHSGTRQLLVVRQVAFPGWTASVNGHSEPLVKVDGVFQGVVIPPGFSRVRLTFTPSGLHGAEVVSLAAVAWAAITVMVSLRRRRRGRQASEETLELSHP